MPTRGPRWLIRGCPREAEIAFGGLLSRFGSMMLAVPADSLRWRPSTVIHGLVTLPVRLFPA